jgi:hypothetical protein
VVSRRQRREWLAFLAPIALVVVITQLLSFGRHRGVPDGRAIFLFVRFLHLGLGLTPIFPLAVLAGALYVGALLRLRVFRRWRRLEEWSRAWEAGPYPGFHEAVDEFARETARSLRWSLAVGLSVGLLIFSSRSLRPRTLEGPSFDLWVVMAFSVTFSLAVASIWKAASLWNRQSDILRKLALHPTVWAYDHMPDFLVRAFRTPLPQPLRASAIDAARAAVLQMLPQSPVPGDGPPGPTPDESASAKDVISAITRDLTKYWARAGAEPPALQKGEDTSVVGVRLREHYLALCMAETLACMVDVTRTMLFIGACAVVAAMIAIASYPFQPAGILAWIATIAVFTLVTVALHIINGSERDEVLSRLAHTTPGRINGSWSLVTRFVGYVLVPVGALLVVHLPSGAKLRQLIDWAGKAFGR